MLPAPQQRSASGGERLAGEVACVPVKGGACRGWGEDGSSQKEREKQAQLPARRGGDQGHGFPRPDGEAETRPVGAAQLVQLGCSWFSGFLAEPEDVEVTALLSTVGPERWSLRGVSCGRRRRPWRPLRGEMQLNLNVAGVVHCGAASGIWEPAALGNCRGAGSLAQGLGPEAGKGALPAGPPGDDFKDGLPAPP